MAAEWTNLFQFGRSQQKALRFFVNRNSENSTKILEAEVERNFKRLRRYVVQPCVLRSLLAF